MRRLGLDGLHGPGLLVLELPAASVLLSEGDGDGEVVGL